MRSVVAKNAAVSGSVPASEALNDLITPVWSFIKYKKYYSFIFCLLEAAFKIHLTQKSEGAQLKWHSGSRNLGWSPSGPVPGRSVR